MKKLCKNKIVDGRGLCKRGAPGLVMGPCIVEIDLIVIREVHNQFEVNRLKGNIGWVWPMWANMDGLVMGPCILDIDCIVIRDVQYHFEVNRYRNEEVNGSGQNFKQGTFQGFSANSVGEDSGQDGHTAEITTISPRF
ncbi:hypothetical protein DPMN_029763 [Dreissena polymorpha]|uniref:Uncharacterized protein n=1 Tax=Dreissena polymorpha TaxID=45954 RepID=A0A9D4LYR1_DREPO|nr:hypothetical protein DPMN_029763 [Dreissena polymorpha]